MSDQYEINEFDEVVHWNCGHRVTNTEREPTEWERQMVAELEKNAAEIELNRAEGKRLFEYGYMSAVEEWAHQNTTTTDIETGMHRAWVTRDLVADGRDDESWIDGQGTTAADLVADRQGET